MIRCTKPTFCNFWRLPQPVAGTSKLNLSIFSLWCSFLHLKVLRTYKIITEWYNNCEDLYYLCYYSFSFTRLPADLRLWGILQQEHVQSALNSFPVGMQRCHFFPTDMIQTLGSEYLTILSTYTDTSTKQKIQHIERNIFFFCSCYNNWAIKLKN